MSWVCTNCSTSNEDGEVRCMVCGAERPTLTEDREPDVAECKVFFSNFEAIKESFVGMFRKKASVREAREESSERLETREETEEERTREKKRKRSLFHSPFADPWPEHRVKFDVSVMESKGYVRSERETLNGVNGYRFYKADESSQFIRIEMILAFRMAKKI